MAKEKKKKKKTFIIFLLKQSEEKQGKNSQHSLTLNVMTPIVLQTQPKLHVILYPFLSR